MKQKIIDNLNLQANNVQEYIASDKYVISLSGYVYQNGDKGLGYYLDGEDGEKLARENHNLKKILIMVNSK